MAEASIARIGSAFEAVVAWNNRVLARESRRAEV
jgi:hypothetical protein